MRKKEKKQRTMYPAAKVDHWLLVRVIYAESSKRPAAVFQRIWSFDGSEDDIDDVGHQRRSCARACRQQCTPPVLFEHITMDHVGETRFMIPRWDVPRTQPVVLPRRLHAPPSRSPFRTLLDTVWPPPLTNCGTLGR